VRFTIAILLCVAVAACVGPDEFQGTYDETTTIPDHRDVAYRLTFYAFGDEVGGVLRAYDVTDPSNSRQSPYNEQSQCVYFQRESIGGDFSVDASIDGQTHVLSLSVGSDSLVGQGRIFEGDDVVDSFDLTINRVSESPNPECSSRSAFDVSVELPAYTVDEYSNLTLAVGFAGYLIDDDGARLTTRVSPDVTSLQRVSDTAWATRQTILLPDLPPAEGMSAADDAAQPDVQYGLGYVVLFDDGNRDGSFTHFAPVDEVVAVSLDQVALFLDGEASDLAPSVGSVFVDLDDLHQGYAVYDLIDVDIAGQNATITRASRKTSDRITLTPVDGLAAFPLLVPTEPAR